MRPSGAPEGWTTRTFGGCARRSTHRVDPGSTPDLPYVGLEHIGVGTLHLSGVGRCADVSSASFLVEPGEVLFGKLRPYFRKVVRAQTRLVCTGEAWVLAARPGVDPHFLLYLAANPAFVAACSQASTGTRMPRADWSFAAARPVALPPLEEQRRIAATLGALDERIALHRAMNLTLEATARALFDSWFVHFDGHRDLVASAIGPVPKGWALGGIDAVTHEARDLADPGAVAPETPYVGLEHVPRRRGGLDTWGRASDATSTKIRFRRGDTLFGRLRPHFHKVVLAPFDGVASTDLLVLRPRHSDWRGFALAHLSSDAMVAHATAAADGTRMPRARWRDLCRMVIPIPPQERAAAYEQAVAPMLERISANVRAWRTLAELRDTLLPELLSGARRVPDRP